MPQKSVLSDLTVSTGLSRRYVLAHFGRLAIAVHLRIRAPSWSLPRNEAKSGCKSASTT